VTACCNIINDGGTYYFVHKLKFLMMEALGYSEMFVSTYHTTAVCEGATYIETLYVRKFVYLHNVLNNKTEHWLPTM
jgi:hypothetical protein